LCSRRKTERGSRSKDEGGMSFRTLRAADKKEGGSWHQPPNTIRPNLSPRRLASFGSAVLRNFSANLKNSCCFRFSASMLWRTALFAVPMASVCNRVVQLCITGFMCGRTGRFGLSALPLGSNSLRSNGAMLNGEVLMLNGLWPVNS